MCDADHAWLFQRDGDVFRWVASFGHATDVHARVKKRLATHVVSTDRGSVVGRAALEARVVHVPDVLADPEYTFGEAQKVGGYRSALGVPLLHKGVVVGAIFITKAVPQPFSDKQIEVVTTFADQAVIAIENTRLFNEMRQRTTDLTKSLEQQTATSEVLKVISSARRVGAGIPSHAGERDAHLRGQVRPSLGLPKAIPFAPSRIHSKQNYADLRRNRVIDLRDNPGIPLERLVKTKQVVHIRRSTV